MSEQWVPKNKIGEMIINAGFLKLEEIQAKINNELLPELSVCIDALQQISAELKSTEEAKS